MIRTCFAFMRICAADGLDVLTSPRPEGSAAGEGAEFEMPIPIQHEILSYTAGGCTLDE